MFRIRARRVYSGGLCSDTGSVRAAGQEEETLTVTQHSLGVCSWSLDRNDIPRAINVAATIPQLRAVQIGFFTEASVMEADPAAIKRLASDTGLDIVSTFIAFEGEDYRSIQSIAATGGLAPDDTYDRRIRIVCQAAEITAQLGATAMAMHIGTVTEDADHPVSHKLEVRCQDAADFLVSHGLELHLETGREAAIVLKRFLGAVDRANVAVNFDPANFVVYGTDDPIAAFQLLAERVRIIHLKDAYRSAEPGREFGRPAALGAGDAGIDKLISHSRLIEHPVPHLIECSSRHAGEIAVREATECAHSLLVHEVR